MARRLHDICCTFSAGEQAQTLVRYPSQEEATRLGAPVIEGCEIDCNCKGIDVLPLVSPASPGDSRLGPQQRLKLNGSARFAGRVMPATEPPADASELATPSFSGVQNGCESSAEQCRLGDIRLSTKQRTGCHIR